MNIKYLLISIGAWIGCGGLAGTAVGQAIELAPPKQPGSIRIATFNVSLNRSGPDRLTQDLQSDDPQIEMVAAIIRTVQPDIVLLNEVDYSDKTDNVRLFAQRFMAKSAVDQLGSPAWVMPYHFSASVNTGEPSGLDLNRNSSITDPEDAWGFGRFPGQYGMAVLSRFPIDLEASRTFQRLNWSRLGGAQRPIDPATGMPYYDDATWQQLRLPSKSFWDVLIEVDSRPLHLLASHPTPPAFDGPEDRNGCRNHDEIQMLVDYISPNNQAPAAPFWADDRGRVGKLDQAADFVVVGDLNCDPVDGESRREAIRQLLDHPRVQAEPVPSSHGGEEASRAQGQKNLQHRAAAQWDTADFSDQVVGNLRVDYCLPSRSLKVVQSGIVWPALSEHPDRRELVERINGASDHHMVWIDVLLDSNN